MMTAENRAGQKDHLVLLFSYYFWMNSKCKLTNLVSPAVLLRSRHSLQGHSTRVGSEEGRLFSQATTWRGSDKNPFYRDFHESLKQSLTVSSNQSTSDVFIQNGVILGHGSLSFLLPISSRSVIRHSSTKFLLIRIFLTKWNSLKQTFSWMSLFLDKQAFLIYFSYLIVFSSCID